MANTTILRAMAMSTQDGLCTLLRRYPQQVVIELTRSATISQIQLLSHQHKIATRVEIFAGSGVSGAEHALWTRLGYMSLDSNNRSQYQARELKSVYVHATGRWLKFVVHRCHVNRVNLFNQVGVVGLNVIGQLEAIDDTSPSNALHPDESTQDLAFDFNVDPLAARQIRSLVTAKDAAVEAEDYDAAKQLKAAEKRLQTLGSQLAQLEVSKRRAVRDEDYDRAKLLKHEISGLRRRINEALRGDAMAIADVHVEDQRPSPPPSPDCEASEPNRVVMPPPLMIDPHVIPSGEHNSHEAIVREREHVTPGSSSAQEHAHTPVPRSKTPQLMEADDDEANDSNGRFETTPRARSELAHCDQSALDASSQASAALKGLPNVSELPDPEPFVAVDVSVDNDFSAVSAFLGEYRSRCLFSKNWTLREAALAKTGLLVEEGTWSEPTDLGPLCNISRIGIQDKVAQVYLTALALLNDVIHKFSTLGFKRAEAFSALEPALDAVVMKMGDNQPRLRDKAVDALNSLSHCQIVGADRVAEKVMHSLDRKRPPHNKWRPVATRLEFLRKFAREFGVVKCDTSSKGGALSLESVVAFVDAHGCASHTFEEVRTATKDLIVDVFIAASLSDRLRLFEPFLEKLRPKQSEEYRSAVEHGIQLNTAEEDPRPHLVAGESFPAATLLNPAPPSASSPRPGDGDERSLHSEDPEEEVFRDQIMKQLEEKAFSVQEAYEILRVHFGETTQNPVKENVLAEWVNEV
mmetsp:Transcript_5419/g.17093  ORF Transcript_5419/g.17093 Transcript_5419/m.17093 type:complete len:749 (+) Transcript_5419:141-2387(+)